MCFLPTRTLVALVVLAFCHTWISFSRANGEDPISHWAIVSIDSSSDALADLLSVELAQWDRVRLIERGKINQVLDELNLSASGLVNSEKALKFGQLAQAEALILISSEQTDANVQAGRRIRLVETRTSMRFLDVVLPAAKLESEVTQVRQELQAAHEKLIVPLDQRILISVAPIKSSEPGEFLRPLCKSLTPLVEVGLCQHPQFIVLERSDLQRLREESKVSGLALKIVGATRFLEVGVRRRPGGQGLEATCQLVTPSKDSRDFDVSTDSMGAIELRSAIIDGLASKLPVNAVSNRVKVTPKEEALVFERRREWLRASSRYADAVEMSEATLALEPSLERIRSLESDYSSTLNGYKNKSREFLPEVEAILHRLNELQLLRAEMILAIEDGPEFLDNLGGYIEKLEKIPGTVSLRKKLKDRANLEWDARLVRNSSEPRTQQQMFLWNGLLLKKLHMLESISSSKLEYLENFPVVFEEILASLSELESKKLTNELIQHFSTQLGAALQHYYSVQEQLNLLVEPSEFQQRLAEDESDCARFANLYGQTVFKDDRGSRAAMELLTLIHDLGVDIEKSNILKVLSHELPPRILHTKYEAEYFDGVLKRAQADRNPSELLAQWQSVYGLIVLRAEEKNIDFATSVLKVLEYADEKNFEAKQLRNWIVDHLKQRGLMEKPPALSESTDLWGKFRARRIKLTNLDRHDFQPLCVNVIESGDSNVAPEVVFAWSRPRQHVLLQRLYMPDGAIHTITPVFKFASDGLQVIDSPDAYFIKSRDKGFAVVYKGSQVVEVFTEAEGAPSNNVLCMAWLKDRMYISYRDAFASFDPKTKSFQLFASSVTVAPRNLIDGRGGFFIMSIVADKPNDCLWMNIQDNSLPFSRNGLWRFTPASNEYVNHSRFQSSWAQSKDGLVLKEHQREQAYWEETKQMVQGVPAGIWIEPVQTPWLLTGKDGKLSRYGEYNLSGLSQFFFVGNDVISKTVLFTPDGQIHRSNVDTKPWNLFQKCGEGFITHFEHSGFDPDSRSIWYVERK